MNKEPALPAIYATPSLSVRGALLDAAQDAHIDVEIRGFALIESWEPTAAIHFDITPWIDWLRETGNYVGTKAVDGIIGIAAYGLMARFVSLVREAVRRADAKPFVDARVQIADGHRRLYNLPVADLDAAAAAILVDVGLDIADRQEDSRFWEEGRWTGTSEWRAHRRAKGEFVEWEAALPRPELFAALKELRELLGTELTYLSRDTDVGIRITRPSSVDVIDQCLRIVRPCMPNHIIGIDTTQRIIVISGALLE